MDTILAQNFGNVLVNLIKSHLNFSFDNYVQLMSGVDKAFNKAIIDAIVTIFERIDTDYRNSSVRKSKYHIKSYAARTLITVFGEVTFKRTYYTYKHDKSCFCYLDRFLGLPKKDIYDPYVKSVIVDFATSHSAPKAADIVSELIGCKLKFKEFKDKIHISRQMVRNILIKFPSVSVKPIVLATPDVLYIMADEKYVPRQGTDGKKSEVKLAVCFDGYKCVDKHRTELLNKHYVSSSSGSSVIFSHLLDYIYSTYEVDKIKKVVFMGDGANWIKNGRNNFKFNKNTDVVFALDHFHFKQALLHITRNDVYGWFSLKYVLNNKKDYFYKLVDILVNKYPHRKDTLIMKRDYVLNNWIYIQNMMRNPKYKCSMEGHISHVLADLFASRPKGYSLKTLVNLLNLRIMNKNGFDIRKIFLSVFNKTKAFTNVDDTVTLENNDIIDFDSMFRDTKSSNIPCVQNGKVSTLYSALKGLAHA